jgi:hypothetical protein
MIFRWIVTTEPRFSEESLEFDGLVENTRARLGAGLWKQLTINALMVYRGISRRVMGQKSQKKV